MKKVISIIFVLIMLFSLTSCGGIKVENEKDFSVISNAEITYKNKGFVSAENGSIIDITFPEKTTFDTVVIKEKDNQISAFSISVKNEKGEFEKVYEQDYIGDYRYCSIGEHTSDAIQINIEASNEDQYKIKDIDVLNVTENKNKDFRVTSYVVCEWFYGNENVDREKLKTITDVILFGIARFDENGEIYYQSIEKDGETIDGKTVLSTVIETIKDANPNINVHCNALGPDGVDADDKERLHSLAFTQNGDKFASNIVNMIKEFGFDGFFFDYEYPYQKQSIKDYSKFLVKLDKVMEDYTIGVALAHWNCNLTKDAIEVIDRVELMSYDDMNSHYDQHAAFCSYGGILGIRDLEKQGYDLSKCDFGLPFYGRTHNGEEAWPSYAQIVEDLDGNSNLNKIPKSYMTGDTGGEIITSFNSVQTIMDKTAFANDYGLGGVMVWHYSCDVPYESDMSLFKAIQTGLMTRK